MVFSVKKHNIDTVYNYQDHMKGVKLYFGFLAFFLVGTWMLIEPGLEWKPFSDELLAEAKKTEKPVITQNIVDGPMRQDFTVDMSNSSYDQSNITGDIVNKIYFDDSPLSPGSMGAFDMASGVDKGFVTAGRYRYSNGGSGGGSGWGGDGSSDAGGHYTYEHGGFDVYAVDWLAYCNPEQNTDRFCEYGRGGSGWGGWGW